MVLSLLRRRSVISGPFFSCYATKNTSPSFDEIEIEEQLSPTLGGAKRSFEHRLQKNKSSIRYSPVSSDNRVTKLLFSRMMVPDPYSDSSRATFALNKICVLRHRATVLSMFVCLSVGLCLCVCVCVHVRARLCIGLVLFPCEKWIGYWETSRRFMRAATAARRSRPP